MTEIYYAFAAGLAAGVVLTVGSFALIALRALGEDDPTEANRDQYFAVLDVIERECKGAEPSTRRALNRLHSKVLGMAQTVPPSVRQYQD